VITRNGKHNGGVHIFDGMPQTLVHGAEEGATKVAEVVETAGVRMAKGAGHVAKGAGQASGRASEISGQLKGQASGLSGQLKGSASDLSGQIKGQAGELSGQLKRPGFDIRDAKLSMKGAKLGAREARLNIRDRMTQVMSRQMFKQASARKGLLPSGDAMLKAQLVKTSRELAHESSDLNAAVDSLNKIIKTNRKSAAKGRTRLIGGVALGAALMYHLDAEHGRERRAATGRLVANMVQGQRRPTTPAG
jgi:hypothetical protein